MAQTTPRSKKADRERPTPPVFPKSLKALNMTYSIETCSQRDVEDAGRNDGAVGATDHHRGRILIVGDMSYAQIRMTLWHEMLHVAFYQGIPQGWLIESFRDDSSALEEFVVSGLEQGMLWLLRNNPKVADFLLWRGDE